MLAPIMGRGVVSQGGSSASSSTLPRQSSAQKLQRENTGRHDKLRRRSSQLPKHAVHSAAESSAASDLPDFRRDFVPGASDLARENATRSALIRSREAEEEWKAEEARWAASQAAASGKQSFLAFRRSSSCAPDPAGLTVAIAHWGVRPATSSGVPSSLQLAPGASSTGVHNDGGAAVASSDGARHEGRAGGIATALPLGSQALEGSTGATIESGDYGCRARVQPNSRPATAHGAHGAQGEPPEQDATRATDFSEADLWD
jgi:uncharacterized membrane-anchored protein YhcB (DUF1043 family)